MRHAFLYRLYPSKAQARLLDSTLETCRRFYNDCLSERKAAWELEQRTVGKVAQLRRVKERKATNPWAKGVHSHVLQTVVQDLDNAFDAFFRRVKAGEEPGHPRFVRRSKLSEGGITSTGADSSTPAVPAASVPLSPRNRVSDPDHAGST